MEYPDQDRDTSGEDIGRRARARIAQLEQRVLDSSDDRSYCLRWIAFHHRLLEVSGL